MEQRRRSKASLPDQSRMRKGMWLETEQSPGAHGLLRPGPGVKFETPDNVVSTSNFYYFRTLKPGSDVSMPVSIADGGVNHLQSYTRHLRVFFSSLRSRSSPVHTGRKVRHNGHLQSSSGSPVMRATILRKLYPHPLLSGKPDDDPDPVCRCTPKVRRPRYLPGRGRRVSTGTVNELRHGRLEVWRFVM